MAIAAGMAVASMIMNVMAQEKAIKAARKYNKAMRNAESVNMAYANGIRSFEQAQVLSQFQQKRLAVYQQKLQAQGEARAKGAASGLTGRGIEKLSQRFSEDAARAMAILNDNAKNAKGAYAMDMKSSLQSTKSRIMAQSQLVDFNATSVLASGVQGYAQGASMESNLKIGRNNGAGSPGVSNSWSSNTP